MDSYQVKVLEGNTPLTVEVPGSKSITNRALMLAALGNQKCMLHGVLFSDDSRAFLGCLLDLGFDVTINEPEKKVEITGTGGMIPNRNATIQVRSAGTAARFLTVMLAFAGGCYTLYSSEQMKKRPMDPLLSELRKAGVKITCLEKEGHFPFQIESSLVTVEEMTIDTHISSQFASALLMSATLLPQGLTLHMAGDRSNGSYILMTISMMEQFGIRVKRQGATCRIEKNQVYAVPEYHIEPDMSAACYFYAMAPLLNRSVTVLGTCEATSLQGDKKFLTLLRKLGCEVEDSPQGVTVTGVPCYPGIVANMKDYSDQALTMAVLAAFADSPTIIEHIGHIRMQECDRIHAIISQLHNMGVGCQELPNVDGVVITPAPVASAAIETFDDHRVAMSFTLAGLRRGGITILNPNCCSKTFENYFDVIETLY